MRTTQVAAIASAFVLATTFFACKQRRGTPDEAALKDSGDSSAGDPARSVVDYAALCKREVGLPASYNFPPLDCIGGDPIPIKFTPNGSSEARTLDSDSWSDFDSGGKRCDNPHWLGGEEGCFAYDHITKYEAMGGNRDVVGILNCRQKYFAPGMNAGLSREQRISRYNEAMRDDSVSDAEKARLFAHAYSFNDLGFIVRNQRTGATCFFTIFGRNYFGKDLPAVDKRVASDAADRYADYPDPKPPRSAVETAVSSTIFFSPDPEAVYLNPTATAAGQCSTCHDVGGWKHSPFILSAPVQVPSNRRVPFLPVGEPFKERFRASNSREVTTSNVDGQPNRCTSCHRLTTGGATCNTYIPWSVGLFKTSNDRIRQHLTNAAQRHPVAHWMPDGTPGESLAEFRSDYEKHIARIMCCCKWPGSVGCKVRKHGPTTAEVEANWTDGSGPYNCATVTKVSDFDTGFSWTE